MKKKILASILSAGMLVSLMAGCGSNAAETDNEVQSGGTEKSSDSEKQSTKVDNADDAIQGLIDSTDGTVELTLWCSETEAYQTTMKEIVDEFEAAYPDVDFDITIGAESEANCKDDVLADPETAADLFVFADDQLVDMVNAGVLQSIDATYTYDPAETNAVSTVEAASVDGTLYAYPLTASNG